MPAYTRRESFPTITPSNTVAVNIAAAHNESAPIAADAVRLVATAPCYVSFGSAPVATSASMYLPANAPEVFQFSAGDAVSVVRSSTDGVLYVSWGN